MYKVTDLSAIEPFIASFVGTVVGRQNRNQRSEPQESQKRGDSSRELRERREPAYRSILLCAGSRRSRNSRLKTCKKKSLRVSSTGE